MSLLPIEESVKTSE